MLFAYQRLFAAHFGLQSVPYSQSKLTKVCRWKVAIILNELEVPYENKVLSNNKNKEKPYTDLNPNGRSK